MQHKTKQDIFESATFLRDFISFMPAGYNQRHEALEEARKIRYLISTDISEEGKGDYIIELQRIKKGLREAINAAQNLADDGLDEPNLRHAIDAAMDRLSDTFEAYEKNDA